MVKDSSRAYLMFFKNNTKVVLYRKAGYSVSIDILLVLNVKERRLSRYSNEEDDQLHLNWENLFLAYL